jgi:hypothetical protein
MCSGDSAESIRCSVCDEIAADLTLMTPIPIRGEPRSPGAQYICGECRASRERIRAIELKALRLLGLAP